MSPVAALANLWTLIAAAVFCLLPDMSRPGVLFGVSVAREFHHSAEGRHLVAVYRREVALLSLGLIAAASLISVDEFWSFLRAGVAGLIGVVCWIRASRKTLVYALPSNSIRTASLSADRQPVPGGWLFVAGPYLILLLAAGFLWANWNAIPESFPVHWTRGGPPDRWASRTVLGVFGILAVPLLTNLLTTGIGLGVFYMSPNSVWGAVAAPGDAAFKRATFYFIVFVNYVVSSLIALLGTRPAWAADPSRSPAQWAPFIVTVVFALTAAGVIYLVRVSRIRKGAGDGTPDHCWKWGIFYYNTDDEALFVETRMGVGWTLNLANKWAWVFLCLSLIPALLIVFFLQLVK
jgi:uncharacterized membrane protein